MFQNLDDNLELVTNLSIEENGSKPKFAKIDRDLYEKSDEEITEYLRR